MKNVNLRGIPDKLYADLKHEAIDQGTSLYKLIIKIASEYMATRKAK